MEPTPNPPLYILQEPLGSGTYATVYRAHSRAPTTTHLTRETVAIKCMRKDMFRKYRSAMDNLVLEIGILKELRHKNIVHLRDFQWDSNWVYLIMEYCAGGDLSKFLARHVRLDERVTRRFLQQLASALSYLRSRNISHMDLKPKNILIDNRVPPYTLKLADFGFAMFLSDDERTASKRGSPLYMAPEMLQRKSYDARVDLWSLGVILFECLFGHPPFRGPTIEELERQILSKEPIEFPSDPQLSVPCFDLVSLLLIRDPNHRITFPAFFEHDFVDLEHAPTDESMTRAISLAREAVQADRNGERTRAVQLYCDAIDYFVPHLSMLRSNEERSNLRQKINNYVRRAEALKQSAKPQPLAASRERPATAGSPSSFGRSPSADRVRSDLRSARVTRGGWSPPASLNMDRGCGYNIANYTAPGNFTANYTAPGNFTANYTAPPSYAAPGNFSTNCTAPPSYTAPGNYTANNYTATPSNYTPPGSLTLGQGQGGQPAPGFAVNLGSQPSLSGYAAPGSLTLEASPSSYTRQSSLAQLWSDVPQVSAALTVIQGAAALLSQERYEEALRKYTLAIESMMQLLGRQQPSTTAMAEPKVECLRREVGKWMRDAEGIKNYIASRTPSVSAVEQRIIDEDFVQQTTNAKDGTQCRTQ